jgi:hypothetical protein
MPIKQIGSAEAKYLAATDVLIGDMSNINYEFLLYDRPVILLANDWVRKHFPDVGIKTDLRGLRGAISRSMKYPGEYQRERQFWLNKTIDAPYSKTASKRYIDIMLGKSGFQSPSFVLLHGNNAVRQTNLVPLANELERLKIDYVITGSAEGLPVSDQGATIFVGAHFRDLDVNENGFKVHIDHDLKGKATANLSFAIKDYKRNNYFPHIDLHITPGEVGDRRTRLVLGPLSDRTVIGGYPKADDFLRLNTQENKAEVYDGLGFGLDKPLVTYAPAGERSHMKPGGSLSGDVISYLGMVSQGADFHILVKRKYEIEGQGDRAKKMFKYFVNAIKLMLLEDSGPIWDDLVKDFERQVPDMGNQSSIGRPHGE